MAENTDFGSLRVLIVEDQDFMRRLMVQMVATLGCSGSYEAENGGEAVSILQNEEVDLVICDLHMDQMNGLEVLAAIRASLTASASDTPVFLLTGETEDHYVLMAHRLHVDAFVTKPIKLDDLSEKIASVMGARTSYDPLSLNTEAISAVMNFVTSQQREPQEFDMNYLFSDESNFIKALP